MSANSFQIQEAVNKAIDLLITNRIQKLELDKTDIGIVQQCLDDSLGEYYVIHDGGIIRAYTLTPLLKLEEGAEVYVLIPKNDFNEKKWIIGTTDPNATNNILVSQIATINNSLVQINSQIDNNQKDLAVIIANIKKALEKTKTIADNAANVADVANAAAAEAVEIVNNVVINVESFAEVLESSKTAAEEANQASGRAAQAAKNAQTAAQTARKEIQTALDEAARIAESTTIAQENATNALSTAQNAEAHALEAAENAAAANNTSNELVEEMAAAQEALEELQQGTSADIAEAQEALSQLQNTVTEIKDTTIPTLARISYVDEQTGLVTETLTANFQNELGNYSTSREVEELVDGLHTTITGELENGYTSKTETRDALDEFSRTMETTYATVTAVDNLETNISNTYVTQSAWTQTNNSFTQSISDSLTTAKNYTDGKISQEVIDRNSAIEQTADEIMAYVGEDYVNEETGESYSLASYIDVLADEINQKVSSDYVDSALTEYTKTSEFTIAPTMIQTEVSAVRTDLSGDISSLSSRVTQTETDITTLFESVDEGGTSTAYIREDATGITVGKVNDPYTAKVLSSGGFGIYNSTSNIYRYLVDDNGTYLYDENGDVRATITSSAGFVAGQTSAYNTQVTDNGLYLRYGNTTLGSFTATSPTDSTITLGSAGSSNYYQVINSEGDAIYNASGYPLQISGANGVAFYDGTGAASNSTQTVLLNNSSLRIGKVNNSHVIITDQGVVISDGTDDLATYASDTITLGKSGSSQQQLTSEGNILLNNDKRTASFTSSGVNFYGSDGTTITSSFNNTGAVIGLESSFHTTTTNSDITFFNGNTVLGQYTGNSIVLGNANTTGTYQTISSAGNVISNSNGYIVQSTTSSGVNFYDGTGNSDSHITASYNSNGARIGKSSNYHVSVTESGILLEDGDTTLSSFGENIVLGEETGVHQIFTSDGSSLVYGDLNNNGRVLVSYSADGMVFYDTNGNETASYTANGAIFGNRNGHHLIITEQYGIQEYYGNTLLNTSNNTSGTTYSENKNFRLGTNSNFIYFDSNTGQIYIQGSGIHFVSSSNKTIDDLLTDIDITTTPVAGGTQVNIGSNSFTVLNGQDGDDGTSISILGSYNSLAELQAAHPTATQGDSYTINGELYTWNGSEWQNVGTIKGEPGDTAYFHTAWATADNGASGFSTNFYSGATWMGTYSDHTVADSTTPSDYDWVKVKGDKGDSPVVTMTQNQDGDIVLSIDGTTYTVHQGVNGESSQWYYGTAITGTSTEASRPATGISSAIVGDMYLNTDTTAVYRCILAGASGTAAWVYAGNLTDSVRDNLGNDLDEAANYANLYLTDYAYGGSEAGGVSVHRLNDNSNFVGIDADGIRIVKNNTKVADFVAAGVNFYDATATSSETKIASFGRTGAQVGLDNSSRFMMNSNNLQAYDSNNSKYFEVSPTGISWGNNVAASTTDVAAAARGVSVVITPSNVNYTTGTAVLTATLYINGNLTNGTGYTWLQDGTVLSGENSNTLTITTDRGLNHVYSCSIDYN